MTTIAYDGKSIACDGLGLDGYGMINSTKINKIMFKDGVHIGVAGEWTQAIAGAKYLLGITDKKPKHEKPETISLLIVRRSGVQICGNDLNPYDVDTPAAIGSGDDLALGAMLAGKTAKQAVAIAAQRDTGTGGRIRSKTIR